MRCPSCKAGSGSLIDMAPGEKLGQFVCPVDPRHRAQLNDLGYMPFLVAPAEPSPLRVPEPQGKPAKITACKWCGMPAQKDFHADCRGQFLAAKSHAHKAATRAAKLGLEVTGLWAFADPSDQGWHL